MKVPPNSVVVFHPAKQHVYQVVLALQRAALLQRFITGIYFKPTAFPYTMIQWLPAASRARALRELKKRRLDELDANLIISFPYIEATFRIFGLLPHLERLVSDQVYWASDLYFRWKLSRCVTKPTLIYGFLGSSLWTFQYARQLGILSVLDVPAMLDYPVVVARAKQKIGLDSKDVKISPRLQEEVRTADFIIVPSDAVSQVVVAQGVPCKNVFVLPFGVDLRKFYPKPELKRNDGTFQALFVGKFAVGKGVHHLLQAWHELSPPRGNLIIAGPVRDLAYAQLMRHRYSDFVEYGNVPHYEIANLYRKSDIFVSPSLTEGSALVTYEALASGLPCIVTAESGSIVRDGIEGFVVPVGDVEALKDRIMRLYLDVELRHRMGKAARRRAEEFTWERYQTCLIDILTVLMNRRMP